jgi:hypothetical protein
VALRRWILRRRIFISGGVSFPEYALIEAEIAARVEKLLGDLDTASAAQIPVPEGQEKPAVPDRLLDWPSLVLETEQTVADLCLLVALLSQKSDFRRALNEAMEGVQDGSDDEFEQRRVAVSLLQNGLERASLMTDRGSMGMLVFTRSCGAILLVAALAGFLWGDSRVAKSVYSSMYLAATYMVSATVTYLIPLFFTLNYQQERKKTYSWENVFSPNVRYSSFATQFALIFLSATVIALIGRLALNITSAAIDVGISKVQESLPSVIEFGLRGEIFDSVNAALFAVMISLIIDAADDRATFDRAKWKLVFLMALAMGTIAAVSRARLSLFADAPMDYALIAKALAAPFLIGVVCGGLVVMTLEDEMPKKKKPERPQSSGKPALSRAGK